MENITSSLPPFAADLYRFRHEDAKGAKPKSRSPPSDSISIPSCSLGGGGKVDEKFRLFLFPPFFAL